ncbi:hypothetical protein PFISCL1PPCAC_8181, partial [Pristionchus fissidentatus]
LLFEVGGHLAHTDVHIFHVEIRQMRCHAALGHTVSLGEVPYGLVAGEELFTDVLACGRRAREHELKGRHVEIGDHWMLGEEDQNGRNGEEETRLEILDDGQEQLGFELVNHDARHANQQSRAHHSEAEDVVEGEIEEE